jgi:putative membrane protein
MRVVSRRLSIALGASALPAVVLAHAAGASHGRFPWSWQPAILALLAVSVAAYAAGTWRLWRQAGRGRGLPWRHVVAWAAGWGVLVIALVSPLDPLGERSFTAHMLQHELLMVVAAPLLVAGRPLVAWLWAMPARARQRAGAALRHPGWRAAWAALTHPLSAFSLHAIALWGWHLPLAFDAALADPAVHTAQHLSFLLTALLFWWTTIGGPSIRAPGPALASLFGTMIHTGALGALMSLSPLLWYPAYAATAPVLGLDPLQDQQLGGLVMWVPAGASYLVAALWLAWQGLLARRPAASVV